MSGIYSLVYIDKRCVDDQYIKAISYNKSSLQFMIDNFDSNILERGDFVIKENIPVYSLFKLRTNKHDETMIYLYSVKKFKDNKLYGFNKITTTGVKQVLLEVDTFSYSYLKNKPFFKNDLSENSIIFDKYYDKGILNT
jgi:hypothetical protein